MNAMAIIFFPLAQDTNGQHHQSQHNTQYYDGSEIHTMRALAMR